MPHLNTDTYVSYVSYVYVCLLCLMYVSHLCAVVSFRCSGKKGAGGTKDAPTGYIAPLSDVALPWNAKYTYDFTLILGNVDDIRATACGLMAEEVEAEKAAEVEDEEEEEAA